MCARSSPSSPAARPRRRPGGRPRRRPRPPPSRSARRSPRRSRGPRRPPRGRCRRRGSASPGSGRVRRWRSMRASSALGVVVPGLIVAGAPEAARPGSGSMRPDGSAPRTASAGSPRRRSCSSRRPVSRSASSRAGARRGRAAAGERVRSGDRSGRRHHEPRPPDLRRAGESVVRPLLRHVPRRERAPDPPRRLVRESACPTRLREDAGARTTTRTSSTSAARTGSMRRGSA